MAEGRKIALGIGIGCGVVALIGIIGMVVCLGVCGAGVQQAVVAGQGSSAEADAFFADLRANNVEAAYQRMSQTYRGAHDLEAFRQAVGRFPVLTQQRAAAFAGFNISVMNGQTTMTLNGQLDTPGGVIPIQVLAVREGESWHLETISVQGQTVQ